jgi:hypothetical protein
MKAIEKIYVCLSIFPFIVFILTVMGLIFPGLGHSGGFLLLFIIIFINIVLGAWGLFLIFQTRKRKAVFCSMIIATLMATSFSIYFFWLNYFTVIELGPPG